MLRSPDVSKWMVSEQLEMKSNEVNQTVQMTHMTVRELKNLGYEVISSTFAYKPKLLAGLAGSCVTAKHLRLDKRKVRCMVPQRM